MIDALSKAFFGTLGQFNRTLGATMHANIEQAIFLTKARRYGSSLERATSSSRVTPISSSPRA